MVSSRSRRTLVFGLLVVALLLVVICIAVYAPLSQSIETYYSGNQTVLYNAAQTQTATVSSTARNVTGVTSIVPTTLLTGAPRPQQ